MPDSIAEEASNVREQLKVRVQAVVLGHPAHALGHEHAHDPRLRPELHLEEELRRAELREIGATIAGGEDIGHGGLEVVVHLDVALLVQPHRRPAEQLCVRHHASRGDDEVAADHLSS